MQEKTTRENQPAPVSLGAVSFPLLPVDTFAAHVARKALAGLGGYCCIANAYSTVLANQRDDMALAYANADLVYPDSRVLSLLAALANGQRPARVERGDRLLGLVIDALGPSARIALVGGRDMSQTVELGNRLASRHGAVIVFEHSPPVADSVIERDPGLCELINRSGANLAVVGLGCPKQELWMKNNGELMSAYCLGVGAAFDYLTDRIPGSPPWVHRAGLEWLWRMYHDPRRLARRNAATLLPLMALVAKRIGSRGMEKCLRR